MLNEILVYTLKIRTKKSKTQIYTNINWFILKARLLWTSTISRALLAPCQPYLRWSLEALVTSLTTGTKHCSRAELFRSTIFCNLDALPQLGYYKFKRHKFLFCPTLMKCSQIDVNKVVNTSSQNRKSERLVSKKNL